MKFHEKCPKCGYKEEENWRAKIMKPEVDMIEAAETKIDLKPAETRIIGQWVYHKTKTGRWVERMLVLVWESWGKSFSFPAGHFDKTRHSSGSYAYRLVNAYWKKRVLEKVN